MGRLDEAKACASRAYAATGATNGLVALGYAEARAANVAIANRIAAKLSVCAEERYVRPSGLAAISLALGRMDAAASHHSMALQGGDFVLA